MPSERTKYKPMMNQSIVDRIIFQICQEKRGDFNFDERLINKGALKHAGLLKFVECQILVEKSLNPLVI